MPLADQVAELIEQVRAGRLSGSEFGYILAKMTGLRDSAVTWFMFSVDNPLAVSGLFIAHHNMVLTDKQLNAAADNLAPFCASGGLLADLLVALSPKVTDPERTEAASRLAKKTFSKGRLFHPNRWSGELSQAFQKEYLPGRTWDEAWHDLLVPLLLTAVHLPQQERPIPLFAAVRRYLRREVECSLLGRTSDAGEPVKKLVAQMTEPPTTDEILEQAEERLDWFTALSRLDKNDQALVVAYYSDSAQRARLAEQAHLSPEALRQRISRIRQKLQE